MFICPWLSKTHDVILTKNVYKVGGGLFLRSKSFYIPRNALNHIVTGVLTRPAVQLLVYEQFIDLDLCIFSVPLSLQHDWDQLPALIDDLFRILFRDSMVRPLLLRFSRGPKNPFAVWKVGELRHNRTSFVGSIRSDTMRSLKPYFVDAFSIFNVCSRKFSTVFTFSS